MKFPYTVKHDGIDYPPGADVPLDKVSQSVKKLAARKVKTKEK